MMDTGGHRNGVTCDGPNSNNQAPQQIQTIMPQGNGTQAGNQQVATASQPKLPIVDYLEKKSPRWQLDLQMEKLRQKASQLKPFVETSKNVRTALTDRRCIMDHADKFYLQKGLDSFQQSISVNSLQSMVERLEMVSRQIGLKFTPGGSENEWFISSDMFYLEVYINSSGVVMEVKIQHEGKSEQQSCPEMVECLKKNDFKDFTKHLEGLVSIYHLNADKKIKSKAFIALQALETDLTYIASTYSQNFDGELLVMKSLIGLVQPRKGGHPLKLVYFVSPYEFLDVKNKVTLSSDPKTILDRKLGVSATILVKTSSPHRLQMSTTVTIMKPPDGKSYPRYGTLNTTNSTVLPVCFVLDLGKPVPVCVELLKSMQKITSIECFDFSITEPILNLVVQNCSNDSLDCSEGKGLLVNLPDQLHCYYMTDSWSLEGILVSKISFTSASQLPQIIQFLRQQLIFNTLIGSCVRVNSKEESPPIIFEVTAFSPKNISISFQHPLEDSLVTLEFSLKDVAHPTCRLHAVANAADIIPTLEEHACRVVQRSMSIPVTLRAVIVRWKTMKSRYKQSNGDFNVPVGTFGTEGYNPLNATTAGSCGSEMQHAQNSSTNGSQPNPVVVGGLSAACAGPNGNANASSAPPQNNASSPGSGRAQSNTGSNVTGSTGNNGAGNFASPMPQNQVEFLSSCMNMNPLLSLSNQLGMGNNFANLNNLSLQNIPGINPQMAMQMNMNLNLLASQLQNSSNSKNPSPLLMNLLDQAGQRGRRRKRKGTSNDCQSSPSHNSNASTAATTVPRPSPSPSPKSPRMAPMLGKSPKRRPSEGSDISEGDSRAATPQTPTSFNIFGSGTDSQSGSDTKWNIDITPVNDSIEALINNKLFPGGKPDPDLLQEAENEEVKGKRSQGANKKARDFSKRSVSLDSHSSVEESAGGVENSTTASSDSLRSLMTPSLSITPVSGAQANSTVNSLLANIRPGIEIIPLPTNPVTIPNSITVTPILPKSGQAEKKQMKEKKEEGEGKKKGEKKERKRKANDDDVMDLPKQAKFSSLNSAQSFMSLDKGKKSMASSSGGANGMNFNMNSAKKSGGASPNVTRAPTPKSSSSSSPTPKVTSQGKPSVSTLKSVSGSPKYQDSLAYGSANKIKSKEKKMVQNPKAVKNLSNSSVGSTSGITPPMIPALKPISSGTGESNINSQLSSALANLSNSLFKSNSDTKSEVSGKIDSPSSSNNNGSNKGSDLAKPSNFQAQTQAAAVAAAAIAAQKTSGSIKKGSLSAVIDKLKSQQSVESDASSNNSNSPGSSNGFKKEQPMGKIDYLKASSAITDAMQAKKSNVSSSTGSNNGSNNGGQNNSGSEYTVKPGAQGLKITLNKAKASSKDALSKDKIKQLAGKSGPGSGTGMKKPSSGSVSKPMSMYGSMKNSPQSSSSNLNGSKKSYQGNKDGSGLGRESPKNSFKSLKEPGALSKNKSEEDLTKKLFMPGAVRSLEAGGNDAPKFDPKFQIPKKSKSSTSNSSNSASTTINESSLISKADKDQNSKDGYGGKVESAMGKGGPIASAMNVGSKELQLTSIPTTTDLMFPNAEMTKASAPSPTPHQMIKTGEEPKPIAMTSNTLIAASTNPGALTAPTTSGGNGSKHSQNEPDSTSGTISPSLGISGAALNVLETGGEKEKGSTVAALAALLSASNASKEVVEKKATPPSTEISPESPDPSANNTPSDLSYKPPTTIPTTPINLSTSSDISSSPVVLSSPIPSPDEGGLVMDIPSEGSNSSLEKSKGKSGGEEESPKNKETMPPPRPPSENSLPAPNSNNPEPEFTPPAAAGSPSVVAAATSTNESPSAMSSASSPASSTAGGSSATAPKDSSTTLVPIVSVHIMHSPQPSSPALLRSPLVAPSPHSSHASPYAIDDDLMDEALIGTGK